MTRLVRTRWFRVGLHLLVIAGLIASLVITWFHRDYMHRGVSFGDDATPIPHTDINPLGVNTFLHEEADPQILERSLDMIAEAGFTWIRQIFVWSEIEQAPGYFWDDQWDVSTWEKYDRIVDMANERGLEVIARIDKPPRWAREGQPRIEEFPDGPPNDYEDFADFVALVVERYHGQISYIQLWNEPNLEGEWGGLPIDPAAFTELLAMGYEAAKAVDPDITVIMPGLAPTDQTGPENLSELIFFEEMYEAGAADYFDVAAVMVYGYGFSPWDRRVSFERNNFSRHIQMREIMERYGDGDKPIWAVEYNWISLPDDWGGPPSPWGAPVSEEEQARYLYEGYLRAQQEWPWMGAMIIWGFRWPTDPELPEHANDPTRGFRLVDHDFTPRPAWERLSYARPRLDRAYTGAYTADTRLIRHDGDWVLTEAVDAVRLKPDVLDAELRIPFAGTGIELSFTGMDGRYDVELNGEPVDGLSRDDGVAVLSSTDLDDGAYVIDGLSDGPHTLTLTALETGDDPLALAGFTVTRHPLTAWIYPWLFAAASFVLLINIISLLMPGRARHDHVQHTDCIPSRIPAQELRTSERTFSQR
jgi:polysaccharide biosynthesis protein PslG